MSRSLSQALDEFRAGTSWSARWTYFNAPEILDAFPTSPAAQRVYRDIEKLARLTRLYQVLIGEMAPMLDGLEQARILDVCCGGGAFAQALSSHWGQAEITGLDHNPSAPEYAADGSQLRFTAGDALKLPFAADSFDVCVNLQSLHHFSPEQVVQVVREACRVARRIFIFDLRRTLYGPWFVRLWSPWMSRDFIHDGVASHRRAYTVAELRFLLQDLAGLPVKVRPLLPVGLVVEK